MITVNLWNSESSFWFWASFKEILVLLFVQRREWRWRDERIEERNCVAFFLLIFALAFSFSILFFPFCDRFDVFVCRKISLQQSDVWMRLIKAKKSNSQNDKSFYVERILSTYSIIKYELVVLNVADVTVEYVLSLLFCYFSQKIQNRITKTWHFLFFFEWA